MQRLYWRYRASPGFQGRLPSCTLSDRRDGGTAELTTSFFADGANDALLVERCHDKPRLLPIGRIVGMDAMHFDWQRLNVEYSKQFGVEPRVPPKSSEG